MARDSLVCNVCPVRDIAACAALNADERDELARLGHHRTLRRGEALAAAGDDNTLSATLITGVLKVSSFDRDGTERILSLIHPAGFVGELFAPAAHHDIVALTNAELCVFPRKQYEAALERFPALGRALLRRSSNDLLESRSLLAAVTARWALAWGVRGAAAGPIGFVVGAGVGGITAWALITYAPKPSEICGH